MAVTPKRMCEFDGCYRRHEAKGLCKYHYNQYNLGIELHDQADIRLRQRKSLGSWQPYRA